MKKYLLLMLFILLQLLPQHAEAGLLVRKQVVSPVPVAPINYLPGDAATSQPLKFLYRSALHGDTGRITKDAPHKCKKTNTAWKGITSISCSTAGILSFTVLATLGIISVLPFLLFGAGLVFGIMGVAPKNKYNGLAIAGLALSLIGIAVCGLIAGLMLAFQNLDLTYII